MTCKKGKLYFTDKKIRGKRFYSKHMMQLNLKVTSSPDPKKATSSVPFLCLEEVNELVNTLLESETLPKRVGKRKLKGVLKDVS